MRDTSLRPLDFQPVGKVLFGPGRIDESGEVAAALGFRRALVVTDRGIVRAGHVDRLLDSLRRAAVEPVVFDGVEENPTTEHVGRAVDAAREHRIDSIIGIGGGSSMDCAKGANFIVSCGGRIEDYWGVGKATRPMLPSMGIPTTTGTGSEAQSFALISDPATHRKMACGDRKAAFRAVILDPDVTASMPFEVLAATGIAAISHAVESFVTARRNPVSMAFSREAWHLLASSFDRVLAGHAGGADGEVAEGRAAMLLGASLSGMAIENSMLGATHSLANPLTARFGIVHGVAIGLLLPHVVRYNGAECEGDYRELALLSDGVGGTALAAGERGTERLAAVIEALRARAGLPERLSEIGVAEADLPGLAEEAAAQWTAQFNPRPVTARDLEELYRCAL